MQKKKLTRNQVASEAKQAVAEANIKLQMQQIMMNAYRHAVSLYFGQDLPAAMVVDLEREMGKAVEKAAAEKTNLDLRPIIDRVVAETKEKERTAAEVK